ncbi:uncharacterized protein LOC118489263 [Helianthus annuus]|uniref:uncharacterized protein LOC118489263 n=1 Tax=Helianthus annuus TaxID=4232 RepID=UPI00165302B5|nr:uncharacterized protein LOC118489263 [Helianthus annuus]
MGRKRDAGKQKAVEPAAPARERKRRGIGIEIRDTEMEELQTAVIEPQYGLAHVPYTVQWKEGSLSKMAAAYQPELYYEKMGAESMIKANLALEKVVYKPDFKALGFHKMLEDLGWGAMMEFQGNKNGDIYLKSVLEWMSTLTKDDGPTPPKTTTLTGMVNGKPATMSFATLKQLAPFDSKADKFYNYVKENDLFLHQKNLASESVMHRELFMLEKGEVTMKRDHLKPLVRLLFSFVTANVSPRVGDKSMLRLWEIPILYAILTGEIKFSFRHLVLLNVWRCRNQKGKKLTPHVRLISALLEKQQALLPKEKPYNRPHIVYRLSEVCLHENHLYKQTKVWHKIEFSDKAKLKILQWGKEKPSQGGMDDLDSSDEELIRRKRAAGELGGEGSSVRAEELVQYEPRHSGYSWGVFDDEMQARVDSSRPPEYADWELWQKAIYDQGTRQDVN